jgi:hypothetical protein
MNLLPRSLFYPWPVVAAALFAVALTGCSVVMAVKQPPKKNLEVLKPGTERDLVIAELGKPVLTEDIPGGGKKDVFTFVQGYTKGAKASRAVFHGVADLFTVGLWEVVGTPIEASFDGKKITIRVIYGPGNLVKESKVLSIADP